MDFMLAKVRGSNTPKVPENKAKVTGERICLDVSYIKKDSMANNKYWMIVEDQFTSYKWSFFMRRKTEAPSLVQELSKTGKVQESKICNFHSHG